jgi:hypothetical protein
VHGAEVAVSQCSGSARRSLTHEAVLCDDDTAPPECTHGAPIAPSIGDHTGAGPPPWSRNAENRSATPTADSAAGWVRARRDAHDVLRADVVEVNSSAKPAIESPFEIERPRPETGSTAQLTPAVSSTIAPVGSATRKLLWYENPGRSWLHGPPCP